MIILWAEEIKNKYYLITEDTNIDWNMLNDPGYHLKNLEYKLIDHVLEGNIMQMKEENTRRELYNDEVKRSNLDHF